MFQDIDPNRSRGTRREQAGGVGPLKNNPGSKLFLECVLFLTQFIFRVQRSLTCFWTQAGTTFLSASSPVRLRLDPPSTTSTASGSSQSQKTIKVLKLNFFPLKFLRAVQQVQRHTGLCSWVGSGTGCHHYYHLP